jgi:predicted dithiol-disulfide oxidoreductase (DUF899 family)
MDLPEVVSRDEWEATRASFMLQEKELSKQRDRINAGRRALPMFRVEKEYEFDTPEGKRTLLEMFRGNRQLIVYHFMLRCDTGGDWCPGCSFWMDNAPLTLAHMHARDTTLVSDCPEPLAEFAAHKERLGWTVPISSSHGTGFYEDFRFKLLTDEPMEPAITCFIRDDDDNVYCTYSTRERGTDLMNTTYNYLDLTHLGRQDQHLGMKWEWVRYSDSYAPDGEGSEPA